MRRRRGPAAAGDAAVIESSWREPERFAVLFDLHAPHIYRYLARRLDRERLAAVTAAVAPGISVIEASAGSSPGVAGPGRSASAPEGPD